MIRIIFGVVLGVLLTISFLGQILSGNPNEAVGQLLAFVLLLLIPIWLISSGVGQLKRKALKDRGGED